MIYRFKVYGDGQLVNEVTLTSYVPTVEQLGVKAIADFTHPEKPGYEFNDFQFHELYWERTATSRLKEARKSAGLTQDQLSNAAQIKLRTLQEYEQGKKDINQAAALTVLKLANALTAQGGGRRYTIEDLLEVEGLN